MYKILVNTSIKINSILGLRRLCVNWLFSLVFSVGKIVQMWFCQVRRNTFENEIISKFVHFASSSHYLCINMYKYLTLRQRPVNNNCHCCFNCSLPSNPITQKSLLHLQTQFYAKFKKSFNAKVAINMQYRLWKSDIWFYGLNPSDQSLLLARDCLFALERLPSDSHTQIVIYGSLNFHILFQGEHGDRSAMLAVSILYNVTSY